MNPDDTRTRIRTSGNVADTYIGSRTSQLGVEEHVGIPDDTRFMHVLTIGPTGFGKTQLMTHAALQDAEKDHGFAMVIPKGNAIDEVLAKLPDDRMDDVIYINPNRECVPAINLLEPYVTDDMTQAQIENQKEIIVSDVIALFKRLSDNWGDRFGRVLETLLRAHLHLNIHRDATKTLMDVFRCVIDQDQLSNLIDHVNEPVLRKQLLRIRELSDKELDPLHYRLDDFMQNKTIRRMVTQPRSTIDFRAAINDNAIILIDVNKGRLGETAATLIGSILLTKISSAIQSRITIPETDREPFMMYVDELRSFADESSNFAKILAEGREYKFGCFLASQYLHQLDTGLRREVTNNCRTKIFFNPSGSEDLARITGMLNGIDREELTSLGKYRAVVQYPGTIRQDDAVICDTYPPWTPDWDTCHERKHALLDTYPPLIEHGRPQADDLIDVGAGENAGGEFHTELLQAAQHHFEDRGAAVNLLYQDTGDNRPDGHIHFNDELAHLEAEHATLSNPARVLTNLQRAAAQDRRCIFVVEAGNAPKLVNIVEDPVNRRGAQHGDDTGSFSYYEHDGEAFTDLETVQDAAYAVYEMLDDGTVHRYDTNQELECPELDDNALEDLETFCMYRDPDSGHCSKLGAECVLDYEE